MLLSWQRYGCFPTAKKQPQALPFCITAAALDICECVQTHWDMGSPKVQWSMSLLTALTVTLENGEPD